MYITGNKVRIISSPYTMFEVGSEYTISYVDDRPYGIYIQEVRFDGADPDDTAQWPFHRDEVELVE
jgi:hypothetical protein